MNRTLTIGIDIGTHSTRVVVAEYQKGDTLPRVLGTGTSETSGLRFGYITNVPAAAESIRKAVEDAEKNAGVKIRKAVLSIGGISLSSETSTGQAIITKADKEITQLDISKALAESEESLELVNKKIIHSFPILYKIDGKEVHGRPEGMKGIKLEVKALYITCLEQHLDDLVAACGLAAIEVLDIIASPLATAAMTLSEKQKAMGCMLVDIGAETVAVAVFENGRPYSLQVFSIGSTAITKDIALGFKIPIEEAESVKRGGSHDFPKRRLDEIIEARLSDIFELVENHLKRIKRAGLLPAGVIVVGGGSRLEAIEELSKQILKLPTRVGSADSMPIPRSRLRDASWFVATGLTLYGHSGGRGTFGGSRSQSGGGSFKKLFKGILDQLLP